MARQEFFSEGARGNLFFAKNGSPANTYKTLLYNGKKLFSAALEAERRVVQIHF